MSTKFSPTPAELALVSQIFVQGDPQKLGILTGDVAVRIFGGAKLSPTVLGEIWSISDGDNNGWLPKKGVAVAVRLIGWAQKGEKVTRALLNTPGPLPTLEGITSVPQHSTGVSLPKSPPPTFPPLTPQDRTKFQGLFARYGPTNGLLSGEKARDVFVKSGLSNEKLMQIWSLADTQDRGTLDSTDFAIGMYFIQGLMSGQLSFIPSALPPGLYQQAGGNASNNQGSIRSHMSSSSGSFSPLGSSFPQFRGHVQPQYTGQSQVLQPDHTGFSTTTKPPALPARPNSSTLGGTPFASQQNGHASKWDVTPVEKANSDRFFDDLDPQRRGYIEGDVAVPFMLKSNLPGEVLAQVWDLADLNNDGHLTRDGFAVAMYLIQKKLSGADIPATLPPSLVPPSMRTNGTSPFSPASSQHQPEPLRDLLWDEMPPASAAPSHLSRQTAATSPTLSSAPPSSVPSRDPFGSTTFSPVPHHDLLGDDDYVGANSPPLHDQSAEIGNVQNQLNSTNRSLETVKSERTNVEQALANQAGQLSSLQTQLASAKAAYETENKLLATLKERRVGQLAEIQKTREELIRAESDLSAVRVEKAEVEGAFLRDKEDARELHRKIVEASTQAEVLKAEVEKAKKDAKQQKGLLAIARKQLSTKETEKAKVEKELEEANTEILSVTKEKEEVEVVLEKLFIPGPVNVERNDSLNFAANQTLPVSPEVSSPVVGPATGKSNNPFERLAMSSGNSTPRSQSPFRQFTSSPGPVPSIGSNGTPTEAAADSSADDPFGFSQTFETERIQNVPKKFEPGVVVSGASTPKLDSANPYASNGSTTLPESVTSPSTLSENDHFVTPPSTAPAQRSQTASPAVQAPSSDPESKFPDLDDTTSPFPIESTIPGHFPQDHPEEQHADLGAQLKELDIDESDSDSDSDDEVPLAELVNGKAVQGASTSTPGHGTADTLETSTASFDDVFGVKPQTTIVSSSPQPPASDDTQDLFSAAKDPSPFGPSANSFGPAADTFPQTTSPAAAGVNAFDEAMGKIPGSSPPSAQQFMFDSAFDDDFDFASASATPISPAPAASNGLANGKKSDGFDSIFSTPIKNEVSSLSQEERKPEATPQAFSPPEPAAVPVPTTHVPAVTFDEAFSGFGSGPTLNLDGSFSTPAPQAPETSPAPADPPAQKSFPIAPVPVSPPKTASSPRGPATGRSSPLPRGKSPPVRVASPKPRVSTSSKEEKVKEPLPRHSKLSLRLPFGKKKKPQELPLPSSQHLIPPREDSLTASSPGSDDVDAVKQITDMGFSRVQAVDALEKYGYDVQRALNSLLPPA